MDKRQQALDVGIRLAEAAKDPKSAAILTAKLAGYTEARERYEPAGQLVDLAAMLERQFVLVTLKDVREHIMGLERGVEALAMAELAVDEIDTRLREAWGLQDED